MIDELLDLFGRKRRSSGGGLRGKLASVLEGEDDDRYRRSNRDDDDVDDHRRSRHDDDDDDHRGRRSHGRSREGFDFDE